MLRKVEEIQAQTNEAFENSIMELIERASRARKTYERVGREELPEWLAKKLRMYGYRVVNMSDTLAEIGWGFQYVE
jgi:hypothetical protein